MRRSLSLANGLVLLGKLTTACPHLCYSQCLRLCERLLCVIVLLCSTPAHLTWSFVAEFADSFRLHGPSEQRTSARQLSSSYRSQIGTNGRLLTHCMRDNTWGVHSYALCIYAARSLARNSQIEKLRHNIRVRWFTTKALSVHTGELCYHPGPAYKVVQTELYQQRLTIW
jgi:hypothetical protein